MSDSEGTSPDGTGSLTPAPSFDPRHFSYLARAEETHFGPIARRKLVFQSLGGIGLRPGHARILDVGCGAGHTLREITKRDWHPVGSDLYLEGLTECAKATATPLVQADIQRLPFRHCSYDSVLLLEVLEHLDDDLGALIEVKSLLKPRGVLVATVPALPCLWNSMDKVVHHRRRYRRPQLMDVLHRAGFEIVRCTYYMCLTLPLYLALVLSEKLGGNSRSPVTLAEVMAIRSPVNRILNAVCSVERAYLKYLPLPLGSSLIALARNT